jgi:hypothetical protein
MFMLPRTLAKHTQVYVSLLVPASRIQQATIKAPILLAVCTMDLVAAVDFLSHNATAGAFLIRYIHFEEMRLTLQ